MDNKYSMEDVVKSGYTLCQNNCAMSPCFCLDKVFQTIPPTSFVFLSILLVELEGSKVEKEGSLVGSDQRYV